MDQLIALVRGDAIPRRGKAMKGKPAAESDAPFGPALRELMQAGEMTFSSLSRATKAADPAGKGIARGHLNMLTNGHDKPSIRVMELVAAACGVNPSHFAEYRLRDARRGLDPEVVGWEKALENLSASYAAAHPRRKRGTRAPASAAE